jgi:hypothetical protein
MGAHLGPRHVAAARAQLAAAQVGLGIGGVTCERSGAVTDRLLRR